MTVEELRHVAELAIDRGKYPDVAAAEKELQELSAANMVKVPGRRFGALYQLAVCFGKVSRFGSTVEKARVRGRSGQKDLDRQAVLDENVAMASVYGAKLKCNAEAEQIVQELLARNKAKFAKWANKGGDA